MNTFDKIAGYKKEKEELRALVEIFNNRKKYELKGATLPKGIIFYGPAGTGKTLFSEVLAEECALKRICIRISDAASENDLSQQISKAFRQAAKSNVPTMIFFDELDKVLPNDDERYYTDRAKNILAQLLTLIDGMERVHNVVFVATCNNYYALPESITRAGRFDKKICLDYPDLPTRAAVLDLYMKASSTEFGMTAESIAKLTAGFSPASLKTLINNCILVSGESDYISEESIRARILEIKEDLPDERSEQSYTVDAIRNTGAFVVARAYSDSDYVLTLDDCRVGNGFLDSVIHDADYDYDDDYYDEDDDDEYEENDGAESESYSLCSKNDLLAAITALLGGVAAEELILHRTYDNLESSLLALDDVVLKMSRCGMLGLGACYNESRASRYSEAYRHHLEEAFLKVKTECYEKARKQVERNEALIKGLVPVLVKRKSIEKAECEALIAELGGLAVDGSDLDVQRIT